MTTTPSQLVDVEAVRAAIDAMSLSFASADKAVMSEREAARLRLESFAKLDAEHARMVKHGANAKSAWASIHEKLVIIAKKRKNADRLLVAFKETTVRQYASAATFALAQGLDDLAIVPTLSQAKMAQGSADKIRAAHNGVSLLEALKVATGPDDKGKTLTIGQVAAAVAEKPAPTPKPVEAPTSSIPKDSASLTAEIVGMAARMADLIGAVKVLTPDSDGRKVLAAAGKVIRAHAATIVSTFDDTAREQAKATVAAAKPSVGKADAA